MEYSLGEGGVTSFLDGAGKYWEEAEDRNRGWECCMGVSMEALAVTRRMNRLRVKYLVSLAPVGV